MLLSNKPFNVSSSVVKFPIWQKLLSSKKTPNVFVIIGLSKKRPLRSKAWSRSEKNLPKKYALPTTLRFHGGGGW